MIWLHPKGLLTCRNKAGFRNQFCYFSSILIYYDYFIFLCKSIPLMTNQTVLISGLLIPLPFQLQCLQKLFTRIYFFHILLCYKVGFSWIHIFVNDLNKILCNVKVEEKWFNCMDNKTLIYLDYISIQPPETIHVRNTFGSDYSCESIWVNL